MTNRIYPAGLKKSCLASLVGLMLAQSTFALESLSDEYLADTTGEGIALLPENFKMVFKGPMISPLLLATTVAWPIHNNTTRALFVLFLWVRTTPNIPMLMI